ncbi:8002_t:CDS:1, partial [Funneliformis caledonium]
IQENTSSTGISLSQEPTRIEPKDTSPQIINGEDLCKYIPNLYRLLELYKDDGSNGFDMFFT